MLWIEPDFRRFTPVLNIVMLVELHKSVATWVCGWPCKVRESALFISLHVRILPPVP
jgi:hypothetical protein